MSKILLIEDDLGLTRIIRDWLTTEKLNVETTNDGHEATELLKFYKYDLIILDLQLPNKGGLEILKEFRANGGITPVLILSGKDNINDIESGFATGADDYLRKPFHMRELTARLKALLRRKGAYLGDILIAGNVKLDATNYRITKNGIDISLLPKEFALLEFLMRHPNTVFSAQALLDRVWSSTSDATTDALTTCVKRLRKKLDDEGSPSLIRTIHGKGYRLEAPNLLTEGDSDNEDEQSDETTGEDEDLEQSS